MGERHTIEVKSPGLGKIILVAAGVDQVLRSLRAQNEFQRLPGFALALALAEGIDAELRASIAGEALREAHRAGFDVGRSKAIYTALRNNNPVLEIEMPDLADMAEQGEAQANA